MRVASAADWRDRLAFETPVVLADLMPGDDTRCFACGPDSELLPRAAIWAYKHRHPKNHDGYVRFYCSAHVPAARRAPVAEPARRARAERAPRADRMPRRPAPTDVVRPMCPNCFIEVSATGECGVCGEVAG